MCVKPNKRAKKLQGKTRFIPFNFNMFHFPYCGFQPIFFAQVAVVRGVTKTQRANSCGSALLRSVLQLPKNICQPGSRPLAAAMAERVIPTVIEVDVDAGPPV